MGVILSVAAEKGGVGKTTTATNLAAYLATHIGRTLLVDMDSQGQAGAFLGYREQRAGMYELLAHPDRFSRGYRPTRELITYGVRENLDLIPNDPRIGEAELLIAEREDRAIILAERLGEVERDYAAIVIDVGPTVNLASLLALYASHQVLVPVAPGPAARAGVEGLRARLAAMQANLDYAPEVLGVVATLVDRRERLGRNLPLELEETYGRRFSGVIRRNTALAEAPGEGKTIFEYAPKSSGALDYAALGRWVALAIGGSDEGRPLRWANAPTN